MVKPDFSEIGQQEYAYLTEIQNFEPTGTGCIIHCYGYFWHSQTFCLVLEEMQFSLSDLPQLWSPHLEQKTIQLIIMKLLLALHVCKKVGFIHGDLKPENILLSNLDDRSNLQVRLADFSNAIKITDTHHYFDTFQVQTLSHRAPEVTFGSPFDYAIDLWSLGCILCNLIQKDEALLFQCREADDLLPLMVARLGPLPSSFYSPQNGSAYAKYFTPHGAWNATPSILFNATPLMQQNLRNPFYTPDMIQAIYAHTVSCVSAHLKIRHPSFVNFVVGLLWFHPHQRMTAKQALVHPYMCEVFPGAALISSKNRMQYGGLWYAPGIRPEPDPPDPQPTRQQRGLQDPRERKPYRDPPDQPTRQQKGLQDPRERKPYRDPAYDYSHD